MYVPEEPEGGDGQGGGVMMCADSAALYEQVRRRYDERGEATDGIHYLIFHSMEELRASPDLLEGARAMVGRVLAGQDWWVEGGRSRCEALYRAHAPTRPTHFVVAIRDKEAGDGMGGDTARADAILNAHCAARRRVDRCLICGGGTGGTGGGRGLRGRGDVTPAVEKALVALEQWRKRRQAERDTLIRGLCKPAHPRRSWGARILPAYLAF